MTLLIDIESPQDKKMLMDLAKRLGLNSRLLSNDDMEDMGIASAMKKSKKRETVSGEKIRKALAQWK